MVPSKMTRIVRKWTQTDSNNPILQMKHQRQLISTNAGKISHFVVVLTLISTLLSPNVAAFDDEQKRVPSTDNISYDYEDGFDPVLTFRKLQDQSMLGKGQKIGEEQASLADTARPRSEIKLTGKVNPDTSDDSEYNITLMNTGDSGKQLNIDTNSMSNSRRQDINENDTTDSHQHKVVTQDKHDSHELHNVNNNFRHKFFSVDGTTLDKGKDNLKPRLTAFSNTDNTFDSGALESNKTHTNASYGGQLWGTELEQLKGTSVEYKNTSREINVGSYNNQKGSHAGSYVSNGAMFFGNSNISENIWTSRAKGKPTIYIAGLFPWTEDIPAGAIGRGVLPAVDIALDHVNTDVRRNRKYILKMASNDTRRCTSVVGVYGLEIVNPQTDFGIRSGQLSSRWICVV